MDVLTAAYHLVHDYPGGPESLAPRLNKSPSSLSHEVKPGYPGAKLGLETAVRMSVLAGDLRVLNAFAADMGCMVLPLMPAAVDDGQTLQALGAMAAAFSELVHQVSGAMADGRVSDNEMLRLERDGGRLVMTLQAVLGVARANNWSGKPCWPGAGS
jgi:hypothetical protein